MAYQYDYAVIGGDMRQVYLVEELAHHTNRICHYALCAAPDIQQATRQSIQLAPTPNMQLTSPPNVQLASSPNVQLAPSPNVQLASPPNVQPKPLHRSDITYVAAAASLSEICTTSSCIIGPIPFSKKETFLNQSVSNEDIPINQILSYLSPGQSFFAGCIPEDFKADALKLGIHVHDLMQNSSLSYFNSIATAEGAISEAITLSPINLHQSSCAVLGYGKCGRTISHYLKGMFCRTFVVARKEEDRASAALTADRTGTLEDFEKYVENFDFIFNTIPTTVVTSNFLSRMKSSVTIIDIASNPGGVDFTAANELGIRALLCPGLPGKYAPSSSARAIKETIEQILKE